MSLFNPSLTSSSSCFQLHPSTPLLCTSMISIPLHQLFFDSIQSSLRLSLHRFLLAFQPSLSQTQSSFYFLFFFVSIYSKGKNLQFFEDTISYLFFPSTTETIFFHWLNNTNISRLHRYCDVTPQTFFLVIVWGEEQKIIQTVQTVFIAWWLEHLLLQQLANWLAN